MDEGAKAHGEERGSQRAQGRDHTNTSRESSKAELALTTMG